MPFIRTGDRTCLALRSLRQKVLSQHGFFRDIWWENLFANVVADPSKKDGKSIVVYYDPDDEGRDPEALLGRSQADQHGTPTVLILSCVWRRHSHRHNLTEKACQFSLFCA